MASCRYLLSVGVAALLLTACSDDEDGTADDRSSGEPSPRVSGERIAFASERDGNFEIYVINPDGTGLTNLTNNPADDGGGGFHVEDPNFAWSPDGRRMAFISDRDGNPEIYVMNSDGTEQTRLTITPNTLESQLDWSPDGSLIAFVATVRDPPEHDEAVYVMRSDGTGPLRIEVEGGNGGRYPAWSPDGRRIAFQSGNLYITNADGSGLVQLTDTDYQYFEPVWSPDGSKIATYAYREASDGSLYEQLFVMRSDGSGLIHVPEGANEDDYYARPSWSPDGKRIVFFSDERSGANLHVMDADGSNERRITESGALVGVWSPHSDVIAMLGLDLTPGDESAAGLFLIEPDGSGMTKVTTHLGDTYFAWSPVP